MRLIGHLQNEVAARNFGDFLFIEGIDNQLEPERDGTWAIWIHAEDELDRARGLLSQFSINPTDPKYREATKQADERRRELQNQEEAFKEKVKDSSQIFQAGTIYGIGRWTIGLMLISVAVFLISRFGDNVAPISGLFITEYISADGLQNRLKGLVEIRHWQVWRLFTPIFIHFGFLHIFFNLWWLKDLGTILESRFGGRYFALMVCVIGALSNVAQYFVGGPMFGGMSGVIYGLVGYIWMRSKYDPFSGLFLHPNTITMLVVWFFICLTGLVGNVANTAHGAGFVVGLLWGYGAAMRR